SGTIDTGDHIFVTETKSWRDAQNHCRDLSSELVSIHSVEENEEVRNISVSQNVWIGLFKDPWKWSDGSNTSFRFWKPGDLILIKENLTWIEAMSYCRRHYVDLIHITTKDIQEKVAEKAKNATSPHVWLGLRYICNFNFWFWTSSSSGCYQNWAPGQGSEEENDCEVSGAIQATGGQQWVSLPQTEKLNFICTTCAG
ncbi:macrophage mannose receptor 1, partial [Cheilinus undulatus]|uniref:macrophage mannose receptor 1 n=1 Tax=Cheilinus undulatus TaxID=241271 RepID=UPI001BD1DF45